MPKDHAKDRAQLREEVPEVEDSIEVAQAKSGSVDERIPEHLDDRARIEAPAPAAFIPQGGVGIPGIDDKGPGEEVLEKEREHLRIKRHSG